MALIVCAVIIVLVWAYVLFLREWLDKVWPEYHWWHVMEDKLWEQSRTILVGRLYWVGGIIIALHDFLAQQGFDWTPILAQLNNVISPTYQPLALAAFLFLTGVAIEWLRKMTNAPVKG